jgi:hemoglobin
MQQPSPTATDRCDIRTRDDIERLLVAFYERAMVDQLLEPVFTAGQMVLATHLSRMASFWEVTLLHEGDYSGRPVQIHRHLVDAAGLRAVHFARWLAIWTETVAVMFSGPVADKARAEAARMGAALAHATGADATGEQAPLAVQVTTLSQARH